MEVPKLEYAIGVDLGGTQIRAALIDNCGHIRAEIRGPTEAERGPKKVIHSIVDFIERMYAALPPDSTCLGVGIGAPGPLDHETGMIFSAPNMPGWENVPFRSILADYIHMPVEISNDANAAVLGEWYFGRGVGLMNVVYITISTGIGSGIIVDGHLLLGHRGAGAELGHMVVDVHKKKTWEQLASGTAIRLHAATMMTLNPHTMLHDVATPETVTAADVVQAAAYGDAAAQQLMQREVEYLGLGFVSTLHIISPEIILVGGSVVTSNPFLLDRARAVVREHVLADIYRSVPIELARLGNNVGMVGAAALVLYKNEIQRCYEKG